MKSAAAKPDHVVIAGDIFDQVAGQPAAASPTTPPAVPSSPQSAPAAPRSLGQQMGDILSSLPPVSRNPQGAQSAPTLPGQTALQQEAVRQATHWPAGAAPPAKQPK